MDTNLLIEILQNYTAKSPEDAQSLMALKSQYPYSQTLQVISAKLSKDFNFDSQQTELQKAAVYSCDRAVLKDVMTFEPETDAEREDAEQVSADEALIAKRHIEDVIDNVDLADTILADLKKLNQLKHNFEILFEEKVKSPETAQQENADEKTAGAGKSKREKIIELAKAMQNEQPDASIIAPVTKRKRHSATDTIIEEIKTQKEEIEPESERQKEQIQIIDQFIRVQPSISISKEKLQLPPADLNSIKSGEFGENIVSETLVEILIKQGKKERAVEVLKKLIWKYPQKKTYFASRIEDLKK